MILFCEDCGEKNKIEDDLVNGITAHFNCSSCGYLNHVSITRQANNVAVTTDCLSQQPDIIGFFLFHIKNGILMRYMPEPLIDSDLILLGNLLTSAYKTSQESLSDLICLTLVISGKNMVIRMDKTLTIAIIAACKTFPLSNESENLLNSIKLSDTTIKEVL